MNDFLLRSKNYPATTSEERDADFLETCKINLPFLEQIKQLKSHYFEKHEIVLEPVTHFDDINNYYYFFLEKIEKRTSKKNTSFYVLHVNDGFGKKRLNMWEGMYNKHVGKLNINNFFVSKFVKQKGFLNFDETGPVTKVNLINF
jgi:hypothetical protein